MFPFIQSLPHFILPLMCSYMDFLTFHYFFSMWSLDRDLYTTAITLQNINLFNYFPTGHYHEVFLEWMRYGRDLDSIDAWTYQPLRALLEGAPDAMDAIHALQEFGLQFDHFASLVFSPVFTLIYSHKDAEQAIDDLLMLIQYPSVLYQIKDLFKIMKEWRNNLWQARDFNFQNDVAEICSSFKHDSEGHFDESKCPKSLDDIIGVSCCRCRIKILMYDFCSEYAL